MKIIIKSYVGANQIKFGMTPAEVRRSVSYSINQFKKTDESPFPTDAIDDLGIQIYYKEPGICEAIEIGFPGSPIIEGIEPIGKPFAEMRSCFEKLDPKILIEDTGLTSLSLGISLYAPSALEAPDEMVEGVLVFERGYFDSH